MAARVELCGAGQSNTSSEEEADLSRLRKHSRLPLHKTGGRFAIDLTSKPDAILAVEMEVYLA